MDIIRIQEDAIDVNVGMQAICDERAGGQAIFLGTVRNVFEGRKSMGLFYEAYRDLAEKEMSQIQEELKRDFDVLHVVMVHRIGELTLGEIAVMVAVSAAHRHQAIQACAAGIDRIKERVPIWKKERWADGQTSWHDDPAADSGHTE